MFYCLNLLYNGEMAIAYLKSEVRVHTGWSMARHHALHTPSGKDQLREEGKVLIMLTLLQSVESRLMMTKIYVRVSTFHLLQFFK